MKEGTREGSPDIDTNFARAYNRLGVTRIQAPNAGEELAAVTQPALTVEEMRATSLRVARDIVEYDIPRRERTPRWFAV